MNFLHILQGQSFGLQSFIFCLKLSNLSVFFNSAGKTFQRISPIALTVSKPNLLVLIFCLLQQTLDCRNDFQWEEKDPFLFYIFSLANILHFYNE